MIKGCVIFITLSLCGFLLYLCFIPVEIIRVDGSIVYLKHMPFTNKGKIDWWNKNREMLKRDYPGIVNQNDFNVILKNFENTVRLPDGSNDGDREDYNCYDDIKGNENCIFKQPVVRINGNSSHGTFFSLDHELYLQKPDGKLILLKSY